MMSFSRLLCFGSSFLALSVCFTAEASAQAPLPSFASMGAMETATNIETSNVMNHLRGLRNLRAGKATPSRIQLEGVANAPAQAQTPTAAATPQNNGEDPIIIFDSPAGKKEQAAAPRKTPAADAAGSVKKTKTKKTKKKGKMYNPALYLEDGVQESSDSRSTWNTITESSQDGGSFLDSIGEFFGGPVAHAPDRKNMPRTAALTSRDVSPKNAQYRTQASSYPGQPLGAYDNAVAIQNDAYDAGIAPTQGGLPPKYAMVTVYGPSKATNLKNGGPAGAKTRETTEVSGNFEWVDSTPAKAAAPQPSHAHVVSVPKESIEGYVKDLSPVGNEGGPRYGNTAIPLDDADSINPDRRWGVFVSGDAVFGNQENAKGQGSTQSSAGGFSVGVDYRVQPKTFVGMALTYAHENFKIGDSADVSGDSVSVSLYGTTTYLDHAYVDGFLSLGHHGFDNERTFAAGTPSALVGKSSPDGFTFNAKAETGYNFKNAGFVFGPFGGLKLTYASLDGTSETGIDGMNHAIEDIDRMSAITSLGFGGSRSFAVANGSLTPVVRMAYNHEFGEGRTDVTASIIDAPITFKSKGVRRTRDWVSFAPSVMAQFPASWQLHASYEHDFFRKDVNENLFNMAAKYRW